MKALSQCVSSLNQTQFVHLSNLSHVIKIAFFKPCVDILIYWKISFNSLSTRRLKISVFLLFCSNFPAHFVRILGSCQFWFDPERLAILSLWLVDSKFGSASVANERAFICPTPATLLNLIFTFYSFFIRKHCQDPNRDNTLKIFIWENGDENSKSSQTPLSRREWNGWEFCDF